MILLLLSLAFASVTEDLAVAGNQDLSEEVRMKAFNSLVMGFPNHRPELEALAKDQDADAKQRWVAIRVMGQSGDPAALPALLALCKDPMPGMRAAAAYALGDLGQRSAADTLGPMLQDDAVIVRAAAATALGQLGSEASAHYLEKALKDKTNYYRGQSLWVRVIYVQALGEIGSPTSTGALIACLDDRDPNVVGAALAALPRVAGFDYSQGRTQAEQVEAWKRWYAAQKTKN